MFIILAWHPATGKTTLAWKLKDLYPDHTIIHTDDYIEHGYKESLYKMLEDLESYWFKNVIVEGVMGSRLARKMQELHSDITIDLYIYITANLDSILSIYQNERPWKDMSKLKATCAGLDTVDQSIVKDTLANISVHINGSAHDTIHKWILWEIPKP